MKIIEELIELKQILKNLSKNNKKISLIPTMGSIHKGHLSLINQSKKMNCISVVTIFVNPLQFDNITDLNNYCMPLIRYRIGDLAKSLGAKDCDCGRGLPLIGDIEGRVQSIIIGANGKYLPGTYFSHLFKDYEFIVKQYQVLQKKADDGSQIFSL